MIDFLKRVERRFNLVHPLLRTTSTVAKCFDVVVNGRKKNSCVWCIKYASANSSSMEKKGIGLASYLAVFAIPLFVAAAVSAQTLSASGDHDELMSETAVASCITSNREDSLDELASESSRCVVGSMLNKMIDKATGFANEGAQARFNDNFRIINQLNYSSADDQLRGDLDVIVPLSFSGIGRSALVSDQKPNALFLQHGVTTWKDSHSLRRNDLRFGVVRRFAVSERPDSGILGVSAFLQQNLERGHKRVVTGVDYISKLGVSSFNYFRPVTGWRQGRPEYEERPMEGMELSFSMDLTTAINLETAVGRWENRNWSNLDRWKTGGRIGLKFKPHTWLDFGVSYNEFGSGSDDSIAYSMTFSRPLGGGVQKQPTWKGLGKFAGGSAPSVSEIWRPNRSVDRIEYVERAAVSTVYGTSEVEGASVRFLQNSVASGEEVRMEVSLSSPVSEDTRLKVRLMPGDGDNPVVPGEDYVNEPVEVVVPSGASRTEISIRLLLNPDMTSTRTLSAKVYPVNS